MWAIKLKRVDTNSGVEDARGKGVGGEGGLREGDGRRYDFGWRAHSAIYRSCSINTHT